MSRHIDADALKIPSEEIIAKMIINSAPSVRCKCDFGKCHEQGDTLYESSDCPWKGNKE